MESKQGDESPVTHDDIFPQCSIFPSLRLYRGFWLPDGVLLNLPRVHASFEECPAPADILLASFPKSGTTWLKALAFATARRSAAEGREGAGGAALEFEEAFELYCQGHCGMGPQWEHVREYWEASKRTPGSVLFLRYEEMLQDPTGNLSKMAEFMGCPFSAAEDDAGVVRSILALCSLDKQRNLAVNKTGAYVSVQEGLVVTTAVENDHMTPEMAARLDGIVEEALKGSGFTFGYTNTSN